MGADVDDTVLKEIREKISSSICEGQSLDDKWCVASLQYCLSLIEELKEEKESLWFMLDEIKKSSTWSKEHTAELKKSIGEHLAMLAFVKKGEA